MYDIAKENGYLITEDYTKGRVFGTSSMKTEHFTPEDLKIIHRNFYKRVKNLYLKQMIQNPLMLIRNVKIFLEFPKNTIRIAKVALKKTSQDYR